MPDEFGRFGDDGKSFEITTPRTPRPWVNYLWNDQYLAIVSNTGGGTGTQQDAEGRRVSLVTARRLFVLDAETGEYHSAGGDPNETGTPYRCTFEMGAATIEQEVAGLASRWTLFVPEGRPCEVWRVELTNAGEKPRNLRVLPVIDTGLQGRHEGSFPAAHAHWDEANRACVGSNVVRFGSWYSHETVGRTADGFLTSDAEVAAWDTRRSAFTGVYGSLDAPEALAANRGCTDSRCEFEPILLALQVDLALQPGESRELTFLAGVHESPEHLANLRGELLADGAPARALEAVRRGAVEAVAGLEVRTPDETFNTFYNGWLKHQLRFNSTWARVYFNGFRDLCQDAANLAAFRPAAAKERFLRVLAHQYASGFAPRAWCEGELIDQDYSDSPVWTLQAAWSLVAETGEAGLLDEEVPFWDGPPGSVYDHLRRAMDSLWGDRGPHGLSRMHSGDWNDVMNGVGPAGNGESVWLSMALVHALGLFAELARLRERKDDAATAEARAVELSRLLNEQAWDGAWYRRAYTDAGAPLGSAKCDEARCFLNPQTWAVVSGVADKDRTAAVLDAVDERLETDIGVKTIDTPYTRFRQDVGFLSAIRPGENVNAGIYVHANLFKVLADCIAGRGDAAWRTLRKVLPFSEYRNRPSAEPFTLPNSYFGPGSDYRYGEAGAPWITGSAGWLVRAVADYLFGLRATPAGLELRPSLPGDWEECDITRTFRGATYEVSFTQPGGGPCREIRRVTIDGEPWDGRILPNEPGRRYEVRVALGR